MALQKNYQKFGISFPNSYHRITNIEYKIIDEEVLNSDTGQIEWQTLQKLVIMVYVYADKAARDNFAEYIENKGYVVDMELNSNQDILKQGYDYLKTLPEYSNSTDV